MDRPTITLCMIVKDETHIIEECLRSMAPYVDRYDITDTGSTDGTPELIKKIMDELNIPGEVYLSDWKGFGDHANRIGSRTESFHNAEGGGADYAWVIDADDYIEGDFEYPKRMNADGYTLLIMRGEFSWWRNQIFKLEFGWKYVGVLHEYAVATKKEQIAFEKIEGNYHITARTEGARNVGISPVDKYSEDAEILKEAIKDEPENSRYQFYLAQSYFDSQQWEKSKEAYAKRVTQGGWNEEVFYSQFRVGMLCGIMKEPFEVILKEMMEAYNIRPIRAEPLVEISRMYRMTDKPAAAYPFARLAADMPYPREDILFISEDVYRFGALDELGATAFYGGRPSEGHEACLKLLNEDRVPEGHLDRVKQNLEQYEQVLQNFKVQQMQSNMKSQIDKLERRKIEKDSCKESLKKKPTYKKKKVKSR